MVILKKICRTYIHTKSTICPIPLKNNWCNRNFSEAADGLRITTLKNGLMIATRSYNSSQSSIGAFIKSGPRYCHEFPQGITHVLKRMAFTTTENISTEEQMYNTLNNIQGMPDCQTSRDFVIYGLLFSKKKLDQAVDLLAESVLRPIYETNTLQSKRDGIINELEQEMYEPEPESTFTQLRFKAAYGNESLGIPETASKESLPLIDENTLKTYQSKFYKPERMVIAGVNVDHDNFCVLIQKSFDFCSTTWSHIQSQPIFEIPTLYKGGQEVTCLTKPRVQPGHAEFPELAYIGVGFEGFPDNNADIFPAFIMHGLLGSGRSFSSGGPGKGLYSLLNQRVLYVHHFVNSCISEVVSFPDSGLFYIHGSCEPGYTNEYIDIILQQYYTILKGDISELDISRAKRQVLFMVLSSLEEQSAKLEDLGRNVLSLKRVVPLEELIDKLESVKIVDVQKTCEKMLTKPPAIAALGQVPNMYSYNDICAAVTAKRSVVKKSRFNFFG